MVASQENAWPRQVLDLLACPVCRSPVRASAAEDGVRCEACGRFYPVREGVLMMLPVEVPEERDGS